MPSEPVRKSNQGRVARHRFGPRAAIPRRPWQPIALAVMVCSAAGGAPAAALLPPPSSAATPAVTAPATPAAVPPLVEDALRRLRGIVPGDQSAWEEIRYRSLWADVTPAPGDELVLAVTVGRDDGFCAVYAAAGGAARLVGVVENLAAVESLAAVDSLGGRERQVLIVDHYDEMFGAFFRATRWILAAWNPAAERLETVWSYPQRTEQYSLDPPLALRRVDDAAAQFLGKTIVVTTRTELSRRQAPGEYRPEENRTMIQVFRWDEAAFRFTPVPPP